MTRFKAKASAQDEPKPANEGQRADERIEARRLEAERIKLALLAAGFDGPHETTSAAMIGPPLGSPKPVRYAICIGTADIIGCGSMVRLDDPANAVDGEVKDPPIERSIFLHSRFHEALINLAVNVDGKRNKAPAVEKAKPKKGKKS